MSTAVARNNRQQSPNSVLPSTSEQNRLAALLPDALTEALAHVVADFERDHRKDMERRDAEARARDAAYEMRALKFETQLRGVLDDKFKEFSGVILTLRGPQGERGEKGEPGERGDKGEIGARGLDGIDGEPGRDGKDGRDGIDGKDGLDGLAGKDGAPGLDGKDGLDGAAGKDGAPGLHGKDGVGISDLIINSEGVLIVSLTNGHTKEVGRVIGKAGAPGRDGRDGAPGGPPGPMGPPGPAGLSFEDKGAWCQEYEYHKGNGVTFGGSYWLAQETTTDKPGTGKAWRLAVRKGRDGKSKAE